MNLTNLTLDKFVAATASGEPVPGGGSISALCGALAAALGEMVARLTLGKKKYADVQSAIDKIIDVIGPVPQKLALAVDLDSDAYDRVFQAYKLPKDTDDERAARTAAIQSALKHAATVPLDVARTVASVLPDIERLSVIGNQNAVTDAYVATLCARTAIRGACANTRINLSSISDEAFVTDATDAVCALERLADETEARVSRIVSTAF